MNTSLRDQIIRSPRLPSLPSIALQVIELVQDPEVELKQIAETIQHDPALSTKILRTVNTSFYGQSKPIATVSQAMVVLGLNAVKTLALGFTLVNQLKQSQEAGFDHIAFWRRSLFCAAAARVLAKEVGLIEQEEAFLAGLLQDMGMMAMASTLGSDYAQLTRQAQNDHRQLAQLEREVYETDHAEMGGCLAEHWRIPTLLAEGIRWHETPDDAHADNQKFIYCVALGAAAADVFNSEQPGGALERYIEQSQRYFDLPEEQAPLLLERCHKVTVEMRRLLDLPTGPLGNADELLAAANDAMLQLTLQASMQSQQLERENQELNTLVKTDSLTGVANRRNLNQFLSQAFKDANAHDTPLSVMFLDTDHFKKFNDVYGHQIGDRVLVELARTLQDHAQEHWLVARYGGEEFAVVMPRIGRVEAARAAETVRKAVERTTVRSATGQPLQITASIGVASHAKGVFKSPDTLIKAADMAVYAAKGSGRNCVRIFTPKPAAPKAA